MKLLVFNYSMNHSSLLFSHQPKVVERLIGEFQEIDVITAEVFNDVPQHGIKVFSLRWNQGNKLRNIYSFYKVSIPLLWKHRNGILFSHMTDVQSALASPICWLFRIKHVLWYAHKSSSGYLNFSYPFLTSLVTSTRGSCPKNGDKVSAIGQAIDFSVSSEVDSPPQIPPLSWYHIGRLDASKNIDAIIECLSSQQKQNPKITLHFYGTPSSSQNEEYFRRVANRYSESNWITFHGKLPPAKLSEVSQKHDAFIHAFWGSLDKALLEAIALKRIVVSSNPEYLQEFQNRSIPKEEFKQELTSQITQLYDSSAQLVREEIERKLKIAMRRHSLDGWVIRLTEILNLDMSGK